LTAVNNEAKPQRSTKADILEKGSGKVFTYEHLRDKCLRHAEEDAAREANTKTRRDRKSKKAKQEAGEATTAIITMRRGQKRKSTTLEVEANSPNVKAGLSVPKGKVARVSDVQAAEAAGVLWMAPVAKMY
jgi:protein-tyrosine-phosphatase